MPHSSGGGSSGGGFHSGSSYSGSSTPRHRYSRTPFAGAICYVYYTPFSHSPRLLYTDATPGSSKGSIASTIFLSIFMIAPWPFLIWSGFHNPEKLSTNYDTSIVLSDTKDLLTNAQEEAVKEKFEDFFTLSGITPALLVVDDADWSNFATLEDYAYRRYISLFSDEKHWLIVFSTFGSNSARWSFEGMQGNDTDNILTKKVTDTFNKTLYESLGDSVYNLGPSINSAFDSILPGLMDKTFYIETPLIIFGAFWSGICAVGLGKSIYEIFRSRAVSKAVVAPADLSMKTCPHCHASYYAETVDKCPRCGGSVDYPRYAHFPSEDER